MGVNQTTYKHGAHLHQMHINSRETTGASIHL